jgi:ornithine cyclodeaminase
MGSDTPDKQEVDAGILERADLVVADSIPQCLERGEIAQALKINAISESEIVELGSIIAGDADGRTSEDQITVADLTGVAVQDIQISKAVFEAIG